jgi:hypothetical protein
LNGNELPGISDISEFDSPKFDYTTYTTSMMDDFKRCLEADLNSMLCCVPAICTHGVSITIKRVIFHDPATIVYWSDGTKTVVKCGKNDKFDKEKGLAMAIVKHVYGDAGRYNEIFKKWIKEN